MKLVKTTIAALALTAAPALAGDYSVQRTGLFTDGAYVPVLMTQVDGDREFHEIGENGLTLDIIMSEGAAVAWAKANVNPLIKGRTSGDSTSTEYLAGYVAGTYPACLGTTCRDTGTTSW
jgi:hypothetical protein